MKNNDVNIISVSSRYLPVMRMDRAFRGQLPRGTIVPAFSERPSDMLAYVYSGNVTYTFSDGTTVEVSPGDTLFIPAGSSYTYVIASERYEYIYADFILAFPAGTAGKGESFRADPVGMRTALERTLYLMTTRPAGYYGECAAVLTSALARLPVPSGDRKYISPDSRTIAEKCALCLNGNISNASFRVEELEKAAGCSEAHLRRVFVSRYGISPVRYLTDLRLQNAMTLLRETDLSVAAIAEMSGFADARYFSRVFRNATAMPPTAWREKSMIEKSTLIESSI